MSRRHAAWIALFLTLACIAVAMISVPSPKKTELPLRRAIARVVSTDDSRVKQLGLVRTEIQFVHVRLLTGPHRGTEGNAVNYLNGKLDFDDFYRPGQFMLAEYDCGTGTPDNFRARGILRLQWQFALTLLFGLLLLLLAGWTGLNALLSFVFAALVLWRLFFPLLLRGWSPLATGFGITALLTAVITLAIGGFNRRGCVAFCGTLLGIATTCLMAVVFTPVFHVNGAVRPFAETLLYSGFTSLDLTGIFIASIFVASSGAVMDLAMDIATAMHEIKTQHPSIALGDHIRSGLRVGRAVIGTMTTTLLLAYSGNHITMFMLFIARGLPLTAILNTPLLAAEMLTTLVGSFGLVTVAPFTAVVAGFAYRNTSRKNGTD